MTNDIVGCYMNQRKEGNFNKPKVLVIFMITVIFMLL